VRICIIGKFPPIQGGVSTQTYWSAHGLAALGHEVHVVTNAKEALPSYRTYMRPEDWRQCEAAYGGGSVAVRWTDPIDRSQSYIPMASPYVTKLATVAARAHAERPFDVIYSHYLEPYGVAGHLAAQMTGVPHVSRMAGSDAGRLWRHPQFELLYDHVLRSAEVVIAVGTVAERAIARGIAPDRITGGGAFVVPEHLFTPEGPKLDVAALQSEVAQDSDFAPLLWGELLVDRAYFGIYGKLGECKGSFALLEAMHRLKCAGVEVGLLVLAHGGRLVENSFRARASELGLADRVLQIPFLPHWRVPEFLRGCLAVCCLEQDFPIDVHSPIIPLEVLMSGTCLVGATEVIRKLPSFGQLPHGYGCVAIEDVSDVEVLTGSLAAIVQDPEMAAAVGARGRIFAREIQRGTDFPLQLVRILESAAARRKAPIHLTDGAGGNHHRFPLTELVAAAIADDGRDEAAVPQRPVDDLPWARQVLAAVERRLAGGTARWLLLARAVQIEIAIAMAEDEAGPTGPDPLFRLRLKRWAMQPGALAGLVPVRDPQIRIVEFAYDVSGFLGARVVAAFPAIVEPRPSYIVAFGGSKDKRRNPLLVDELTVRILRLSDETRTAAEIAWALIQDGAPLAGDDGIAWIENLFLLGLLSLQDSRAEPMVETKASSG
jgi:glycosyltransferase involved in cell wall biosynthesis